MAYRHRHGLNTHWVGQHCSDEAGDLLHHGYTRRRPTAAERAFVTARDKTCRAPGCTRPALACDQDHYRQQAKDGGPAHRGNLCVL